MSAETTRARVEAHRVAGAWAFVAAAAFGALAVVAASAASGMWRGSALPEMWIAYRAVAYGAAARSLATGTPAVAAASELQHRFVRAMVVGGVILFACVLRVASAFVGQEGYGL